VPGGETLAERFGDRLFEDGSGAIDEELDRGADDASDETRHDEEGGDVAVLLAPEVDRRAAHGHVEPRGYPEEAEEEREPLQDLAIDDDPVDGVGHRCVELGERAIRRHLHEKERERDQHEQRCDRVESDAQSIPLFGMEAASYPGEVLFCHQSFFKLRPST
jgi:hypothetical protein